MATGTYKPQIRVWDLDQLSQKFERHSDAENVDFVILSDDWTKSIYLQNDRTIELHTQGGFHYRTRIPRFGRTLAYHFPSCDAYVGASGSEVYRLNLEQGRFMTPLALDEKDDGEILGVNVVDINPVHQLLAFGIEGNGTALFWDPRSRASVGTLRLPSGRLASVGKQDEAVSVTAIASRVDGLSYAIGTSTGHTLLYDIRAAKPFALKDQGYGLPVKNVSWIEGGSRMAGDGMVLSADKKVIKIWVRNSPASNFVSITPTNDLNDVHHLPGSGIIMTANEGIQMGTYYIPQLGPAPRWASFLENITEEMEDQTTRSVYEDYKFIERSELKTLGLDHLVGTPALKPYMHGYFLSLKLYDTARLIANPFAYDEHREKLVRDKMEKMAETRIRSKKDAAASVKVNKALAEKILRDEERARKKAERRKGKKGGDGDAMDVDVDGGEEDGDKKEKKGKASLLEDPRFTKVFADPSYAIDEDSREYALLNPSSFGLRQGARPMTAVEDEEEESDKYSSDPLDESDNEDESDSNSDSSDEEVSQRREKDKWVASGGPKSKPQSQPDYTPNKRLNMVPLRAQPGASSGRGADPNATFGQRVRGSSSFNGKSTSRRAKEDGGGAMEVSWVPSSSGAKSGDVEQRSGKEKGNNTRRKGVETFGAGMERGFDEDEGRKMGDAERHGRTQRRKVIRSGSKNAFRRI
ncbi:unnamed protein product [Cyclocybe aegerita]|uniref:NUC153 domain-containing protein n=1 Tax=Cyclocybe aegerita TaxID=1973307 RepID=A0A8S0VZB9_CYCAE|nr:unnamed protein product [Cyclocybe aegerita]